MAILAFKDAAKLKPIQQSETFTQANSSSPFTDFVFNNLAAADVDQVYKFDGTNFIKLATTEYTLASSPAGLSLTEGLNTTDNLIVLPINRLNMNFGGIFGAACTNTEFVLLERETEFAYDALLLWSRDVNTVADITKYDGAVVVEPNQTMFNSDGLTVHGLKCFSSTTTAMTENMFQNQLAILNGIFIGKVLANTSEAVLVDNLSLVHVGDSGDSLEFAPTGSFSFALDEDGSVPPNENFHSLIALPALGVGLNEVGVWVRDTMILPETSSNFPNMAIRVRGVESNVTTP